VFSHPADLSTTASVISTDHIQSTGLSASDSQTRRRLTGHHVELYHNTLPKLADLRQPCHIVIMFRLYLCAIQHSLNFNETDYVQQRTERHVHCHIRHIRNVTATLYNNNVQEVESSPTIHCYK